MATVIRNICFLASRKGSALAALAPIIVFALACATGVVEKQREDSFFVRPSSTLIVNSDGGRINVSAGPEGVVVIHAALHSSSKVNYQVSRVGDTITI